MAQGCLAIILDDDAAGASPVGSAALDNSILSLFDRFSHMLGGRLVAACSLVYYGIRTYLGVLPAHGVHAIVEWFRTGSGCAIISGGVIPTLGA